MEVTYETQNSLMMHNLSKFYSNHDNLKRMLRLINGESKTSLRIVEWFVTNYAKKHFTIFTFTNGAGKLVRFNVYANYKLLTKGYQKKRFDPFCRKNQVTIPFDQNTSVQTTVGQLNFFRWAIENKVLDYIEDHYDEIVEDSQIALQQSDDGEEPDTDESPVGKRRRKKRKELSISATRGIKKEYTEVVVTFN
jgi:hypothetical protein